MTTKFSSVVQKVVGTFKTGSPFKAVTWNVYYGSTVKVLEPVLKRLLKAGVSMFLMQEAGGDDITNMLERNGLKTYVFGQYRLAWDPKVWEAERTWYHELSDVVTHTTKGDAQVPLGAAIGRFKQVATGAKLKALSYHLPPHTQNPEWNKKTPNRWTALHEGVLELVNVAWRSRTKHMLFGGDDNVDEAEGNKNGRWDFMLNTAPLNLVRAPKPTHGNRRIDDFRVTGLKSGKGRVFKGGGDHGAYVREFDFV